MHAKILREFELLEEYGNELREPYSKYIEDGIFELRVRVGTDISRIFYFFHINKIIVLTNGYVKKNQKIERGDLNLAKKYRIDFLSREEEKG